MSGSTASISGYVRNALDGETLLMASVVLEGTPKGTTTNSVGYFTLNGLEEGEHTLLVSYVGFRGIRRQVTLREGEHVRLDIAIRPVELSAGEVVVSTERQVDLEARNIGVSGMTGAEIRQLPTVLETDVFRSLHLLPGVKTASDFSSGLYIRGGSPDQTLIQLDHNTIYNPSHLFGFFSTFNPDAIKDVRLHKGGYPAEYGGRLGSVLDIYNKDGNRQKTEATISLGLLAWRAMAGGPFPRGSWMLAARRSMLEPLMSFMRHREIEGVPNSFYFYDVNGKVSFDASKRDKLHLTFYSGNDHLNNPFLADARLQTTSGNRTASGTWTHVFTEKLFSTFTLATSHYYSLPRFDVTNISLERNNRVDDVSVKTELEYIPDRLHDLKVGLSAGNLNMQMVQHQDSKAELNLQQQTAYASAYLQHTWAPLPRLSLRSGLRANYFDNGQYLRLEPRISTEYQPYGGLRLQAGYGRYYQFLTLSTSEIFSALDAWLPAAGGVQPSYGDQYVAGAKTRLASDIYLDLEAYYRTMEDLFEVKPFLVDAQKLEYADLFHFGQGYARGLEVQLQKQSGPIYGFVSYTFGRTRRRFPDILDFRYYSPKHDRTHDAHVVLCWQPRSSWRITGVFTYATGQAYTQPKGTYILRKYPLTFRNRSILITEYNRDRMSPYQRMDLGIARSGRVNEKLSYNLQLEVFNLTGRRNLWFYFFEQEDGVIHQREAPQIVAPIPDLSLSLTF